MSWNPLKKLGTFSKQDSQQNAPTNDYISPSSSNSTNLTTNSNDLKIYIQEMVKLEKECTAILKYTKKLTENITSLNRFQIKISDDLSSSSLCREYCEDLRALVEEWYTFNKKVNELSDDYNIALQKVLIEPIKQFQQILNELKTLVRKSETNLTELTKQKNKVMKLEEREKQAKDWLKLNETKETCKKLQNDFDEQTETLLLELPLFLQTRIEYFQPVLEGFIKSESFYWGETLNTFVLENQQNVSQFNANKLNLEEYENSQKKLLSNLTALSIVDDFPSPWPWPHHKTTLAPQPFPTTSKPLTTTETPNPSTTKPTEEPNTKTPKPTDRPESNEKRIVTKLLLLTKWGTLLLKNDFHTRILLY